MTENRGSFGNYYWSYTASRYFLVWFYALHLIAAFLLSAVCATSFAEPWPLVFLGWALVVAHALWSVRKHVGKPVELALQNEELVRLIRDSADVVTAAPYEVISCRWLGSQTLVASIRSKQQAAYKRLLGLSQQALVFCADNSSAEDRHRLATLYFSGPTTQAQLSKSLH